MVRRVVKEGRLLCDRRAKPELFGLWTLEVLEPETAILTALIFGSDSRSRASVSCEAVRSTE